MPESKKAGSSKKEIEKVCVICGALFLTSKSHTKYCTKCRDPRKRKAYLQKVKAAAEVKPEESLITDAVEAGRRNITYGKLQAERYLQNQHAEMQQRREAFKRQQERAEDSEGPGKEGLQTVNSDDII